MHRHVHEGALPAGIKAPAQDKYGPWAKAPVVPLNPSFKMLRCLALASHRFDAWRFSTDKDMPLTHNLAEQAVRLAKVSQQDCCGGFPAGHGATTFLIICSCLSGVQKQRDHLFDYLVSTFTGQPLQPQWAGWPQ